eukprot:TRINITY_DN74135_c0_g1_i1.p5 TRINITY_DN74135_c0_g1~~TRINITY_DN74135_c0_g1_i1.p5  ORF type:complete len:190 (-),score=3.95 TRINITY_DN74135_c0_g1_i1:798-1367(-)
MRSREVILFGLASILSSISHVMLCFILTYRHIGIRIVSTVYNYSIIVNLNLTLSILGLFTAILCVCNYMRMSKKGTLVAFILYIILAILGLIMLIVTVSMLEGCKKDLDNVCDKSWTNLFNQVYPQRICDNNVLRCTKWTYYCVSAENLAECSSSEKSYLYNDLLPSEELFELMRVIENQADCSGYCEK